MDIIRGRGVWKIVSSKLRPSVQEPIAQVSVDFASPKVMGSRRRHIPFRMLFLPSNQSICFLKKGLLQKMGYHLSKCFFCEIRNSHMSCCVIPTGANSNLHFSKVFFSEKQMPENCLVVGSIFCGSDETHSYPPLCLPIGGQEVTTQQEKTPREQGRRRECFRLPPFEGLIPCKRFLKKVSVRASVQPLIALLSINSSKKKQIDRIDFPLQIDRFWFTKRC